jgi:flagellar assembly protein FliH
LSKTFIPTLSSSLPQTGSTTFEVAWPQLKARKYLPSVQGYLKEVEERVLKETRERALFLEKEAYEKGFAQGEKDGREVGEKRIEKIISQCHHLLEEIVRRREELFRTYEKEMIQLALSVSRKVIQREVMLQEEVIFEVLREALRQVVDSGKVVVRVHPIDYQTLVTHPDRFPMAQTNRDAVRFVEDQGIERGGCLVETSFGEIDGTLQGRLDEIASCVWEQWERSGQPRNGMDR